MPELRVAGPTLHEPAAAWLPDQPEIAPGRTAGASGGPNEPKPLMAYLLPEPAIAGPALHEPAASTPNEPEPRSDDGRAGPMR
jgi:hypothetical protein